MTNSDEPKIVKWPSDEDMKIAFETYALAIGKVAFAWNYLHEKIGRLFVIIAGGDRETASAVWYAPDSDRTKQDMFKAAVNAAPDTFWPHRLPKAKEHLTWLIDTTSNLGDLRNNALHAPCILIIAATGTEMAPAPLMVSGHNRAQKLRGKEILVEFDWFERRAESLSRFCQLAESAFLDADFPWPDKPEVPIRRRKDELLNRSALHQV